MAQGYDERVKSISLPPSFHERVTEYARKNGISVSEVTRDLMTAFETGDTLPARERTTKRVAVWVDPEQYARFMKKVREQKTTIAAALEAAAGDDL